MEMGIKFASGFWKSFLALTIETLGRGDCLFFSLDFFFQLSVSMGLSMESELRELKINGVTDPKLSSVASYFTHFPRQVPCR